MSIQQQARGTEAAWEAANPVLAVAEIGYIIYDSTPGANNTNAGKFKIGDGVKDWMHLPIASGDMGPTGPKGTYTVSSTPPANPVVGDMWFNDTNAALSIYYDSYWVETTGQQGPTGPAPITNVSSPLSITGPTSAQIISISDASATSSGVITTGTQTIAGDKTFSGTISLPSTTSIGNVSATEIGYIDGVTSSIQTQINSKASLTGAIFTGGVRSYTSLTPLTVAGSGVTISAYDQFGYPIVFTPYYNGSAYSNSEWYFDAQNNRWVNEAHFQNNGNMTVSGSIRSSSINKVQQVGANVASTFTSTTQFTSLMSVTITTTGNPVLINVTGDLDLSVDTYATMRILRDGTTQAGSQIAVDNTASGQNLPFAISVWDDVAAGTHTYYLQGQIKGTAATGTIGNVSGASPVLWAWEVGA